MLWFWVGLPLAANLRLPVEAPNPGNPVGRDCRGRLLPSRVERHDIPPWCLTDSPSGQKVRQVMPARSAKTGRYITKATVSTSFGPGVPVDPNITEVGVEA